MVFEAISLISLVQHNLQFLTFRGHLLDVPFKLVVVILLGVGADSVTLQYYGYVHERKGTKEIYSTNHFTEILRAFKDNTIWYLKESGIQH